MRKRLLAIILYGCLSVSSFGQMQNNDIAKLKKLLLTSVHDTARLNLAFQLANGYRFSNVDSSLFYSDVALEYAIKLQLPASVRWILKKEIEAFLKVMVDQ